MSMTLSLTGKMVGFFSPNFDPEFVQLDFYATLTGIKERDTFDDYYLSTVRIVNTDVKLSSIIICYKPLLLSRLNHIRVIYVMVRGVLTKPHVVKPDRNNLQ